MTKPTQPINMDSSPIDRFNVTLIAVFFMGVASLLPWSFFITAENYWKYKFRTVSANDSITTEDESLNGMQKFFMTFLSITSNVVFLFSLGLNTVVSKRVSCDKRISYSLTGTIGLFFLIFAFVKVDTDKAQTAFLVANLLVIALINVLIGFLMGASMGICGYLPAQYMTSTSFGQAMGGLICCVVQIFCLLLNLDVERTALIYFATAILILAISLASYRSMSKSDYFLFHEEKSSSTLETTISPSESVYLTVFRKGWHYHVGVALVYGVTLSFLPSLVVLVKSVNYVKGDTLTDTLFTTLACFTAYNLADCVGRYSFNWRPLSSERKYSFLLAALLRVAFIPLFVLCNVAPDNRVHSAVLFKSDTVFIVLILLSGLTNGYLINAGFVHAPKTVELMWQDVSGSIVSWFAALGCAIGSVISYGVVELV